MARPINGGQHCGVAYNTGREHAYYYDRLRYQAFVAFRRPVFLNAAVALSLRNLKRQLLVTPCLFKRCSNTQLPVDGDLARRASLGTAHGDARNDRAGVRPIAPSVWVAKQRFVRESRACGDHAAQDNRRPRNSNRSVPVPDFEHLVKCGTHLCFLPSHYIRRIQR